MIVISRVSHELEISPLTVRRQALVYPFPVPTLSGFSDYQQHRE